VVCDEIQQVRHLVKTLIIDDDPDIAEAVALCFEVRWPGTEVITAADGHSGIRMFHEHAPDFVVLDLGLPDMDGVDVCKVLRQESDVAIVMLTVRNSRNDTIRGLESGADDYITKPFDQMELLARARSILRRGKHVEQTRASFAGGKLIMDLTNREVRVDGSIVRLTPTEYNLLSHLAQNPGRLLTHNELLTKLWGQEYSDATDYLKVHVMHLRKKLGDDANDPSMIVNERSVGYKLVA
jgi:two-component system KDP operon response regulator KdpE